MNNQLIWLLLSILFYTSCRPDNSNSSCNNEENCPADSIIVGSFDSKSSVDAKTIHAKTALIFAYPNIISEIADNFVILTNGKRIVFDDGKEKNDFEVLEDCDVEDMFRYHYCLPDSFPTYMYDPGRGRCESLFKAMYGKTATEVSNNLVYLDWFGQKLAFNSVNGAADSLKNVACEIAKYSELRPYLKSGGTYYWRPVRGSTRLSAHSYGIAIDIAVDKSDFWQWRGRTNDETARVEYTNRIPAKLVEIFQSHGFIWGGAWYHFDTMHFEFRPEIIKYGELIKLYTD